MRVTSSKARFVGGVLYQPGQPFEWPWSLKADMLEVVTEAPTAPVTTSRKAKSKAPVGPQTLSEITKADSAAQEPKGAKAGDTGAADLV